MWQGDPGPAGGWVTLGAPHSPAVRLRLSTHICRALASRWRAAQRISGFHPAVVIRGLTASRAAVRGKLARDGEGDAY